MYTNKYSQYATEKNNDYREISNETILRLLLIFHTPKINDYINNA